MAEPRLSMMSDEDLPRTLRREKEARARESREREAREREAREPEAHEPGPTLKPPPIGPEPGFNYAADGPFEGVLEPEPVSVSRLEIPFLHLMLFFIKAVFAAIPALILLVIVAYLIGETLQSFIPWMRQFEIVIRPPTG